MLTIHYVIIDEVFASLDEPVTKGIRSGPLLLSALAGPRQTYGGQEVYPDFVDKAAVLFRGLIKNHPFVDGNKRTALMTLIMFLEVNGFELQATRQELLAYTLDVAKTPGPQLKIPSISENLRNMLHPIPRPQQPPSTFTIHLGQGKLLNVYPPEDVVLWETDG